MVFCFSVGVNWIISSGFLEPAAFLFRYSLAAGLGIWILPGSYPVGFFTVFSGGACSVSTPVFHLPLWCVASVLLCFSPRSFSTNSDYIKFVFGIWLHISVSWSFALDVNGAVTHVWLCLLEALRDGVWLFFTDAKLCGTAVLGPLVLATLVFWRASCGDPIVTHCRTLLKFKRR